MLDPLGVGEIPLDGLAEAGLETLLREPVELALDLAGVDGVAAVVAGAILHVSDELRVRAMRRVGDKLIQQRAEGVDNVDVGALVVAADVVALADVALLERRDDSAAVVLNIEPVADLLAVAVDRQRLALKGVRDHERDELLWKLIWPVVVRAVGDDSGQPVGMDPGTDEVVRGRLGRSVWAVGGVGGVFVKGWVVRPEGAVDLVGGDVQEAEAGFLFALERVVVRPGGLEEGKGAVDIGAEEGLGAVDRAVDVTLSGEVDDRAGFVLLEKARDERNVADVALDKGVGRIGLHGSEIFEVSRIGELVQIDDRAVALREPLQYEIRPDESRSTGYESTIRHFSPLVL